PILTLDQVRIAFCAVCCTVTVVWPPLVDCVGRLAFSHSLLAALAPGATGRPPATRPLGTPPCPAAALCAAACAACIACTACVARDSELSDWLATSAACCALAIAALVAAFTAAEALAPPNKGRACAAGSPAI